MIYRALLRLYPTSIREQFAEEMLAVHSSACERARSASRASYLRFQVREIAGILFDLAGAFRLFAFEGGSMKRLKWIAAGGLLGLLAASAFLDFGFEEQYRSTAVIRVAPGMLAERYLGKNFEPQQLRKIIEHHAPNLLSRSTLVGMITKYDLYPTQIKRKPIEDIIEDMRSNSKLQISNNETLQISFAHSNRFLAQKIVNEFVSRIFQEETRFKLQSLANTVDLLKEESDLAKNEWIKAEDAIRKSEAIGQLNARLTLDMDLAHDRYKASRNELAEVQKALIVVIQFWVLYAARRLMAAIETR